MRHDFAYRRLDKNDAAVLLVDHQSGLCNIVGDFSPDDFKNNVVALGDAAKYFTLPTILTTSFEGPRKGVGSLLRGVAPLPHLISPCPWADARAGEAFEGGVVGRLREQDEDNGTGSMIPSSLSLRRSAALPIGAPAGWSNAIQMLRSRQQSNSPPATTVCPS